MLSEIGAVLLVIATAYCQCRICCLHDHGITYSGNHVEEGITAACGEQLYGKVIYIESIGSRFCEDTGSKVKGNRVDIYFPTHEEALKFGKKRLKIRVLGDWRK